MTPSAAQVLADALGLAEDERLAIGETLIDSVPPPGGPETEAQWRETILRRAEEFHAGLVVPVTWDEVQRRAREDAGG